MATTARPIATPGLSSGSLATPAASARGPRGGGRFWVQCGLILLCVLPFWHVWSAMFRIALRDASLGYILLIPLAAIGLGWQRRGLAKGLVPQHRWVGVLIAGAGIALNLGWLLPSWGGYGWHLGPVLVLYGAIVATWGVGVLTTFAPVLAVFLLIVPPPESLLNKVAYQLMFVSATITTDLLRMIGYDVQQYLHLLVVEGQEVNVAQACSGLRSFFSLFVVITVFALAVPFRWWLRLLMIALTPVMALVGNMVRLVPTCMMYATGQEDLASTAHDLLGFVAFAAIVMLYLAGLRSLAWAGVPVLKSGRKAAVKPTPTDADTTSQRRGVLGWAMLGVLICLGAALPALAAQWPTASQRTYHSRVAAAIAAADFSLPGMVARDSELPGVAMDLLQPNAFRCVELRDTERPQALYVSLIHCRYVRDMMGHTPPVCYPNSGWALVGTRSVVHRLDGDAGGQDVPMTEYRFQRVTREGGQEIFVHNGFITPDRGFHAAQAQAIGQQRHTLGSDDAWGVAQLSVSFFGLGTPEQRDEQALRLLTENRAVFDAIREEVVR